MCVILVRSPDLRSRYPSGHYRLWVNGIHHGDVSFNNLMYDISAETNDPVGIVNDFDLATWVNHTTTNNDRTGTIPFMAIDMLDGGLDRRAPRLYRHDLESFAWVLAYITIANIEYKDCTISISAPLGVSIWFKDDNTRDRNAHILSKRQFDSQYGIKQPVIQGYYDYLPPVHHIIKYWCNWHQSLQNTGYLQPRLPGIQSHVQEDPGPIKPEVDNPSHSLKLFLDGVEKSLVEDGLEKEFAKVKSLLLEALTS